jgi:hypothetical protein
MRTAIASLVLIAGLTTAAQAQTPPTAPAAPAQPASAAAAPPAAAPAEPPPSLPTSGDGAQVLQALEKVCMPAVRGQGIEAAAKAAGLKANRRDGTWTMPLAGGRDYAIIFQPQFSETNVCRAEVHYAVGQDKAIVSAINVWAFMQEPKLVLQANFVNVDPDGVKRIRKSWEHFDAAGASRAVNFSVERKPDDTPLNPKFDTGMLFYQERK